MMVRVRSSDRETPMPMAPAGRLGFGSRQFPTPSTRGSAHRQCPHAFRRPGRRPAFSHAQPDLRSRPRTDGGGGAADGSRCGPVRPARADGSRRPCGACPSHPARPGPSGRTASRRSPVPPSLLPGHRRPPSPSKTLPPPPPSPSLPLPLPLSPPLPSPSPFLSPPSAPSPPGADPTRTGRRCLEGGGGPGERKGEMEGGRGRERGRIYIQSTGWIRHEFSAYRHL